MKILDLLLTRMYQCWACNRYEQGLRWKRPAGWALWTARVDGLQWPVCGECNNRVVEIRYKG